MPVQGRITIKDIARDLGLSYATVSLALNDAPGVNTETKRRIKDYARQVRYRANASARAISTGRTYLIGVILGRITDSFFEEIVQGIENVANRHGYDVIIHTVGDGTQPETEFIERLIGRHIDGLIAPSFAVTESGIRRLEEVGIPILLLRPDAAGAQPFVMVDQNLGGELAVRHLWELGHRRILFLGDDSVYSRLRAEGAMQAVAAQGEPMETCPVKQGLDMEAAYYSMRMRLRRGLDFTAVFCADDVLGAGACQALQEEGIAIPQDVSVVGFDDLRWTRLFTPPLTTIHQPQVSQGETAMQMLIDIMEGREVTNHILQPRLIIRGSTGPAKACVQDTKRVLVS